MVFVSHFPHVAAPCQASVKASQLPSDIWRYWTKFWALAQIFLSLDS